MIRRVSNKNYVSFSLIWWQIDVVDIIEDRQKESKEEIKWRIVQLITGQIDESTHVG